MFVVQGAFLAHVTVTPFSHQSWDSGIPPSTCQGLQEHKQMDLSSAASHRALFKVCFPALQNQFHHVICETVTAAA